MQRVLTHGSLILGLALVVLATAPAPAAAYGGSSIGGGFAGAHGGFGFHVGAWGGSRGFGHGGRGFYGPAYRGNQFTFGYGAGQYPGPRRLGHGWLDEGHRPPVATPLPSPGRGHSGRYGHLRRVHRPVVHQYLPCGPYPCAPPGIGYFAPVYGQQLQRAHDRTGSPRYRGTGRYDRYRVE